MSSLLGSISVAFGADTSGLMNGINAAKGALAGFSSGTVTGLAGGIATALAGAGTVALGFGAASVRAASDFQSSMLKVQAYAGMTGQETANMGNAILAMAPQLGVAPKSLADGLYYVASAGFRGADALNVLKYAGMTAAASNTSATTTTSALVAALNSMGMSGKQAGQMSDELNATVSDGVLSWQDYGNVVGRMGGSIAKLNEPQAQMQANFLDSNAALDVFTNSGVSARMASMQLNNTLIELNSKTDTIAKNAKAMGMSFDEPKFKSMDLSHQLAYLQEMTKGNSSEMLKLMGGNSTAAGTVSFLNSHYTQLSGTIADITSKMKNGQSTQDKFNTAQQGLNFQLQKVQAAMATLMITIGQALLPVITNLVSKIAPLISQFSDWLLKSGALHNVANGLAVGLGFLMNGIITLITVGVRLATFFQQNQAAMTALKIVLIAFAGAILAVLVVGFYTWATAAAAAAIATLAATWPVLAIGAAIALLAVGIYLLVTHWTQVVAFLRGLWTGFMTWLQGALANVKAFFTNIWNSITGFLQGVWNTIVSLARAFGVMLLAVILGPVGILVILIAQHWTQITSFLSNAWNNLIGMARSLWSRITSTITGLVGGLVGQMFSFGQNLIQGFINGITSMLGNVANAASNVMNTVKNFLGFHSPAKMGPGAELDIWGPNLAKGFAQGLERGIPMVQASVQHLISPTTQLGVSHAGQGHGAGGAAGGSRVAQPIIIEMNGQEIARAIAHDVGKEQQRIMLRKSGRGL